jgi:3D (Asp-Asp-Asp) domain-containing protein
MKKVSMFAAVALLGIASRIDRASGELPVYRAHEYVEVHAYAPRVCVVLATAYNSEVGQTDDTPHITAAQTPTRWGVVAARWLPAGTRVRLLSEHFGDEVFLAEDVMPPKNWCKMDIWHQEKADALEWGKRFVAIEVLDVPEGFECPVQPLTTGHKCPEPESDWQRIVAQPRPGPVQAGS